MFAYFFLVYGLIGNFQLIYTRLYVLIASSFVVNIVLYSWSGIKALKKLRKKKMRDRIPRLGSPINQGAMLGIKIFSGSYPNVLNT